MGEPSLSGRLPPRRNANPASAASHAARLKDEHAAAAIAELHALTRGDSITLGDTRTLAQP